MIILDMFPKEKLLKTIKLYHPKADLDLVDLAYDYAEDAHKDQKRLSGVPYFTHPLHTAQRLAEWHMPPNIIIAGLLHDVYEDAGRPIEEIEKNFGGEIASLVLKITKLSKVQYRGVERYVENLRKMFLAFAEDIRVIFIKFADRIDNLEDLYVVDQAKQKRIALESLEIYAAIANRLGMGLIRRQLEDLSFKYIYPKEYEWVKNLVSSEYEAKEKYLEDCKLIVREMLKKEKIKIIEMDSRTKGFYSLYKKLLTHDRDISQVYDIIACRVVVPTVADCYAALGILHSRWKPLKGRIKDYIALPKPNGYQSLHSTVFCEKGQIVEFQIRTQKMHDEAKYGVAAHWFFKEKGAQVVVKEQQLKWLKELAELQKEIQDKNKFLSNLDTLKIDVFQNRIFIFTPKGDVVDLPEGATPVDFAYAIHSDIGNKCSGARVNEQIATLDKKLLSGDVVEIITDKNRKGPSADWLKFAQTHNAKIKIRDQIKKSRLKDWLRGILPHNGSIKNHFRK